MGPIEEQVAKIMERAFEGSAPVLKRTVVGDDGELLTPREMFDLLLSFDKGLKDAILALAREMDGLHDS